MSVARSVSCVGWSLPGEYWTEAEVEELRSCDGMLLAEVVKRIPKRTLRAIKFKAYKLNLHFAPNKQLLDGMVQWLPGEITILKQCGGKTLSDIRHHFLRHRGNAVLRKARRVGVKLIRSFRATGPRRYWTDIEIALLRAHQSKTPRELVKIIAGRSGFAIRSKAKSLGIVLAYEDNYSPYNIIPFSAAEDSTIRYHVGTYTLKKLAKMLNRTECSVKHRVYHLGLTFREHRVTLMGLARMFGVSRKTVRFYRNQMGQHWCKQSSGLMSPTDEQIQELARVMLKSTGHFPDASGKKLTEIARGEWDWNECMSKPHVERSEEQHTADLVSALSGQANVWEGLGL